MKIGIVVALLIAVAGIGLGAYYYWLGGEIADVSARLVTEEQLAHPEDPATASGIKLAPIQCERVYDLRANPIARVLRRAELKALWRHCERIADVASGLDQIEQKKAAP
jgi:hypothetical protein